MAKQNRGPQLWIFDLDGTLADSFPSYREGLEEIFQSHGSAFTTEHLRELLGSNPLLFFRKHLGEARAEAAHRELNRLSLERAERVRAYEGIHDILTALEDRGERLAVWTARDRASAERVLHATDLGKYFGHWISSCCVERTKPFPDGALKILEHYGHAPGEAFMVGDHVHDMEGAQSAAIRGVRVGWNGFFGQEACTLAHRQFQTVTDFTRWATSPAVANSSR